MNRLRLDPGTLRNDAATLAQRVGEAVSLIVLVVGVALAGTMLPWAVGEIAPGPVPLASLERMFVGTGLPASGALEQPKTVMASSDGIAVSEAVTLPAGAAVVRATSSGGE